MKTWWIIIGSSLLGCSSGGDDMADAQGVSVDGAAGVGELAVGQPPAEATPAEALKPRERPTTEMMPPSDPGGTSAEPEMMEPASPTEPSDPGSQAPSTDGDTSDDPETPDPMDQEVSGPVNGDPNAPVVELDDVPCRSASDLSGPRPGGSSINAMIDGRELAIDYPCGKHEGAHMTVILNLHGTLIGGASFLYQRSYFSAYRYADSHNLIVIHPQSVSRTNFGAQWGNDDGGQDLPHLIAVMSWAYENFSKFDIRSTWIAGHSWGAVYAEGAYGRPGFVCDEMFQDRFKGVIGLSYIAAPQCAERVSMIGTQGEEEDFDQLDQGTIAQMHGCDPGMKGPELVGNNERYYWDGCDPGWVHEDWNMLGKGHIDSMDAEVVEHIVEQIKSTEL